MVDRTCKTSDGVYTTMRENYSNRTQEQDIVERLKDMTRWLIDEHASTAEEAAQTIAALRAEKAQAHKNWRNRAEAAEAKVKELEEVNAILMGDDEDKPRYTTKRLKQEIARATEALRAERDEALSAVESDRDQWKELAKEGANIAAVYLKERNEARKALEPFANAAEGWSSKVYLDTDVCCQGAFTVGDLRRARDASSNMEGGA